MVEKKFINLQLDVEDALKLLFALEGEVDLPPMFRRGLLAQIATVVYALKEENKQLEEGASQGEPVYCVGRDREDAVNFLVHDVLKHNKPLDLSTNYESNGDGKKYNWGVDIKSVLFKNVDGIFIRNYYRVAGKEVPGGVAVTWYQYEVVEG